MTKEELNQEVEEKYFKHKMIEFQDFYNRHYYYLGYLESAEPREKRIAELEKENAELKEKLGDKVMQKQKDKADLVWKLKTANEQKATQLSKAKEIIKKLYSHVFQGMSFMEINDYNVQKAEAEQFLNSEVLDDK